MAVNDDRPTTIHSVTIARPTEHTTALVRTTAALLAMTAAALAGVYYAARLRHAGLLLADFDGNVFDAGRLLLHGEKTIPGPTGWSATATAIVAPFSLLPYWAASFFWDATNVAAFIGGLWLLGCRDRRAIAVALLSLPRSSASSSATSH